MIETILLEFLSEEFSAYMEMPEDIPEEPFLLIEKTGGREQHHISSAVFAIKSYGNTLLAAAELNQRLKARMKRLPTLDSICKASLRSDYNFTDTATKRYRYQAVFDIVYYEEG